MPAHSYANWETGRIEPGALALGRIMARAGVNANWLLTGEGPMLLTDLTRPVELKIVAPGEISKLERGGLRAVPLLPDEVAAGQPRHVWREQARELVVVHVKWCPHPAESVACWVAGDSMVPLILPGSIIVVDRSQYDPDAHRLERRVVLMRVDGAVTVKRLYRGQRKGRWIGMPENENQENRAVALDFEAGDAILGLVRSVHAEVR